jgi:hypothetical protein
MAANAKGRGPGNAEVEQWRKRVVTTRSGQAKAYLAPFETLHHDVQQISTDFLDGATVSHLGTSLGRPRLVK